MGVAAPPMDERLLCHGSSQVSPTPVEPGESSGSASAAEVAASQAQDAQRPPHWHGAEETRTKWRASSLIKA